MKLDFLKKEEKEHLLKKLNWYCGNPNKINQDKLRVLIGGVRNNELNKTDFEQLILVVDYLIIAGRYDLLMDGICLKCKRTYNYYFGRKRAGGRKT